MNVNRYWNEIYVKTLNLFFSCTERGFCVAGACTANAEKTMRDAIA